MLFIWTSQEPFHLISKPIIYVINWRHQDLIQGLINSLQHYPNC